MLGEEFDRPHIHAEAGDFAETGTNYTTRVGNGHEKDGSALAETVFQLPIGQEEKQVPPGGCENLRIGSPIRNHEVGLAKVGAQRTSAHE